MGYGLRGSEREGVGSCVRLSESVPAFAIKSGRAGAGEARVLKCSLRRVGFCLPRAVSERLFDSTLSQFGSRAVSVSRIVPQLVNTRDSRVTERNDSDSAVTALYSREFGGKSSRPQNNKIFSDANKVIYLYQ